MRTHWSRGKACRAAFTLTELLVGMLILTIGLLAISSMVPTAYTNLTSSDIDTQALAFTQKRLDQLRALQYTNSALTGTTSGTTYTDTAPATGYTQTYKVEADTPITDVKRITVTVSGPRGRKVELMTLITQ